MRRKSKNIALLLAVACVCCGCGTKTQNLTQQKTDSQKNIQMGLDAQKGTDTDRIETKGDVVSVEDALWHFSYALFQEKIEEKNPVLSPVSAYLALGMTELGARGDTLTEFEQVLGKEAQTISENLVQQIPTWLQSKEEAYVLELANSVWLDTKMTPEKEWLQEVSDSYLAEVFQTELSSTSARKDINRWVKTKTHDLVKEFLGRNLESDTQLILCNTIYFKGEWENKFKHTATKEREFHLADGTVKQVEMMQGKEWEIPYMQNDEMEGVILAYRDGTMGFAALKPTNGETVRALYENLTQEAWNGLLENAEKTLVNIRLPKFEVEMDVSLNDALKDMGLQKAFDKDLADFTGIGVSEEGYPISIGSVRQKAVVTLDEEGTEAAAVTMIALESASEMPKEKNPIDVFFDEPFLYTIFDQESNTPLFIGIIDEP